MKRSLWDYMTAEEQLLCDAAKRRRDRDAYAQHWLAALARVGLDASLDADTREWAQSHFSADARRRLFQA
jgi:hypothetical protein